MYSYLTIQSDMYIGVKNTYDKTQKKAIGPKTTTLFLYLSGDVRFINKYVRNIDILVPTKVIRDSINGKIDPVSFVRADVSNVPEILSVPDEKNVITRMSKLHRKPAINAQSELTSISGNIIFLGPKLMSVWIIFYYSNSISERVLKC
ncbi:hypothetical protein LR004_00090 [Candidatus Gracilibacteria bacterium]|nr:hypothetical protein [Candidatus Gracilibacteria bacterium]